MFRNTKIKLRDLYNRITFFGSNNYWEKRYAKGGNSGKGSYGNLASFKADFLNSFVKDFDLKSVVEFGCGDGNQISLFKFISYTGLDVSKTILNLCIEKFRGDNTKKFFLYTPEYIARPKFDLALS